jgi:pSer/pThr/pTyr-binding forkhead associated (FHA) protein
MENQAPKVSPSRPLALRFISGKYQGGEFPLGDAREIVVGRSSDLDMVLVEDMVSRRHARIACADEQIVIEDLGSTNGTFVNGEKIKRATLKEGDRVLIGTSILKVVAVDGSAPAPRARVQEPAGGRSGQAKTMSGSIDEIPLPDLMQLLGSSKKSGILVVRSDEDVGRIYLRKGTVYFASINELADVSPLKAIFRVLTWSKGTFDLEPAPPGAEDGPPQPGEINASVQELLMEGLRQIDELNAIRHKLPTLESRLVIPHPLTARLRELSPAELDVVQLSYNHGNLAAVLNNSSATDLDTARAVLKLISAGYLRAE